MALTVVQHPASNNSSQATSTTYTQTTSFVSPITIGNTILVLVGADSAGFPTTITITDDLSNVYTLPTAQYDYASSGVSLQVAMIGSATNTPQTISVTAANATSGTIGISTTIWEISGGTGVADYANHQSIASTASTSIPFTTSSINELAFAITSPANGFAITLTNGWTQDTNDGFTGTFTLHSPLLTSSGSNSLTYTSTAQPSGVIVVSFAPTGSSASIAWVT